MKESFPSIVDEHFTANMESLLDGVEEGNVNWKTVVRNFYPDLDEAVKAAQKDLEKVKIEDEVTDVICDVCGRNMVVKYGRMVNSLRARDFRNAGIQNLILKKSGLHVRNAARRLYSAKRKKAENISGVRIIQNAIL